MEKQMTPAEEVIMQCLWESGEDLTVYEITERLRMHYGKDYANNAVATFMKNLLAGCVAYLFWRLSARLRSGYHSIRYLYQGLKLVLLCFCAPIAYILMYLQSETEGNYTENMRRETFSFRQIRNQWLSDLCSDPQ